jgi:putative autotransporter adhesin-like protein
VEGSGDVDARKLEARDVEASIEGSGNIDVHVSGGKLSATVEGSGDVRWSGTASIERVRISGSGEVARRD